jgi:hypothetical protein
MKFIIVLGCLFLLASFYPISGDCLEDPWTDLPFDVGDTLPNYIFVDSNRPIYDKLNPSDSGLIILSPAIVEDVEYYYAFKENPQNVNQPRVIKMILVRDRAFVTPEVLFIGLPFEISLQFSRNKVVRMYDALKVYAKLPSGWNAAYKLGEFGETSIDEAIVNDTIPVIERKIDFFFKYSASSDYKEYEMEYLDTAWGRKRPGLIPEN